MDWFARPRVFFSRCLGFEACRWNGAVIADPFAARLAPLVDCATACPEKDLGLGVPRDPLRVVRRGDGPPGLVQPATGRDLTGGMQSVCAAVLDGLGPVDGFVLKSRSPSCGFVDVPHYSGPQPGASSRRGAGFFGAAVAARHPLLPREDEGRLRNYDLREHFLTRIHAQARLRQVRDSGDMAQLVRFQSAHKLLLMAHSQSGMRALGALASGREKMPWDQLMDRYQEGLSRALARMAGKGAHINTLMHAMGYFKKGLSAGEKSSFLDTLEDYRASRLPLSAVLTLLRSWTARFDVPYLAGQVYFSPYPAELVELSDSGKGRDYR